MADDKFGAFAIVLVGSVFIYSAVEHKRVIDVLLMRPSTIPAATTSNTGGDASNSYVASSGSPVREAICAAAQEACAAPQGTFQYDEIRPIPNTLMGPPNPVRTDCSGFATLCYKAAGAKDPNGLGYSGQGYTGTLLARGRTVTAAQAQPGDLVFWSTPDHVAIYLGNGNIAEFGGPDPDPQDIGPIESTVTTESAYHRSLIGYRAYVK